MSDRVPDWMWLALAETTTAVVLPLGYFVYLGFALPSWLPLGVALAAFFVALWRLAPYQQAQEKDNAPDVDVRRERRQAWLMLFGVCAVLFLLGLAATARATGTPLTPAMGVEAVLILAGLFALRLLSLPLYDQRVNFVKFAAGLPDLASFLIAAPALLVAAGMAALTFASPHVEVRAAAALAVSMLCLYGGIWAGARGLDSASDAVPRLFLDSDDVLRGSADYATFAQARQAQRQGEYEQALNHFQTLIHRHPGGASEGPCLVKSYLESGRILVRLGRHADAESRLWAGVGRAGGVLLYRGEIALMRGLLAEIHHGRGEYAQAIAQYQEALELAEEFPDAPLLRASLRAELGRAQLDAGNRSQAVALLTQALALAEQAAASPERVECAARVRLALARAARELNRPALAERALSWIASARAQLGEPPDPVLAAWCDFERGKTLALAGRRDDARAALAEAVRRVEEVRGQRLGTVGNRQAFLRSVLGVYEAHLEARLGGEAGAALAAAELARSRTLGDRLGGGRPAPPPAADADAGANDLFERLRRARLARRVDADVVATACQGEHDVAAVVEEETRALDAHVALISYYLLPGRLLAFAAHAGRTWLAIDRPTDAGFAALVADFRTAAQGETRGMVARGRPVQRADSERLGEFLLGGLADTLAGQGVTHLVIEPHGLLHYLPFAALRVTAGGTNRYLCEQFSHSLAPNLLTWRECRRSPPADLSRLLVVGDPLCPGRPPLPHAADEARAVASLPTFREVLGGGALVGAKATRLTVERLAKDAGLIHLACHGAFEPAAPLASGLELAGGRLETHRVAGLQTAARLVVLSACVTGVGEVGEGDEIQALHVAFLIAGARAIVATLWDVGDESTGWLMRRFYHHLANPAAGTWPVAEALRLAQLDCLADGRFARPACWAAFALTGAERLPRPAP